MKNFSFLLIAFVFIAPCVQAGQPINGPSTPPFPSRTKQEPARGDQVLKPAQLDPERRKMMWQDKTVDKEGFLRVKSSADYLDLPNSFSKHPKFSKTPTNNRALVARGDLEPVGRLDEDQNRTSYLYSLANTKIAFTVWKYKAAGATYSVPEEFLNQTVGGKPAVLSLSYAEKSTKALWKLTWWDNGVMYELYASDTLDQNGRPQNKPYEVVRLADLAIKRVSNS